MGSGAEPLWREWLAVPMLTGVVAALALCAWLRDDPAPPTDDDAPLYQPVEVVGAVVQPGLYQWPEGVDQWQFIDDALTLLEGAEPQAATVARRRGQVPQLRIPLRDHLYVYFSGAVAGEGWRCVPTATSWRQLPQMLPLTADADAAVLARRRRPLRPWERVAVPHRKSRQAP